MQIFDKRLDEIKPYENNPRNNDGAVEAVSNSIKRFGFKVPIVVDSNGVIVAGHTRYKAAQLLGLQSVPCIVADDLTDEQVKAFRLADNKVSELATWDDEKLDIELDGLADFDMSEFGFSLDDLEDEPGDDTPPSEPNFNYKEQYAVVVTCKNEQEQEQTYNKLTEMGFECKVVAV
jgi:ParB-like chromosome segregation protein Spo0J